MTDDDKKVLDLFAAHALQALLASGTVTNPVHGQPVRPTDYAREAYRYAQAMMLERAKSHPGTPSSTNP